jgi:hypothetical protein
MMMTTTTEDTMSIHITAGTKVRIVKGCRARGVTKGSSAVVEAVDLMGAEYSNNVRVTLKFLNSFLSGRTLAFYASHMNRLGDAIISLNDGRPEHRIEIQRERH